MNGQVFRSDLSNFYKHPAGQFASTSVHGKSNVTDIQQDSLTGQAFRSDVPNFDKYQAVEFELTSVQEKCAKYPAGQFEGTSVWETSDLTSDKFDGTV